MLRQAVDVMGPDRLLFGTDSTCFPRGWRRDVFDAHLTVFEEAKLDGPEVPPSSAATSSALAPAN